MELTNALPIVLASAAFLALGFRRYSLIKSVKDFLPVAKNEGAKVSSSSEFSASTVATTVSLATIVAAYFSLAGFFGLWLIWTALTGAAGMIVVYLFADRISAKLAEYEFVPSIHEFLSHEYRRPALRPVAALLTVTGLLLLLATELIVGSRFLGAVLPSIPSWAITVTLAAVVLVYVSLGGFTTVMKTDRIQMWLIWLMIPAIALAVFTVLGSVESVGDKLSSAVLFKPVDSGLAWFLVGIFLMNVPTHLCSITVWQRAAACEDKKILKSGLFRSSAGVLVSWAGLVCAAWLAVTCLKGDSGSEVFTNLITDLNKSSMGLVISFLVLLGLYSALLSTSSTLLIAIAHTFTTDITSSGSHALSEKRSMIIARCAIVFGTIASCGFVALLQYIGFNIEDLIFSIYGGALSLFPPIVIALSKSRQSLSAVGGTAVLAIVIGFASGWGVAFYGKLAEIQNLVFLSPALGMGASAAVMALGLLFKNVLRSGSTCR